MIGRQKTGDAPKTPTPNKPQFLSLHVKDEDASMSSRVSAVKLHSSGVLECSDCYKDFFCQVFSKNQLLGEKEMCESAWILLIADFLDITEKRFKRCLHSVVLGL